MSEATNDAALIALAALVFHNAALISAGQATADMDAVNNLTYLLRERGLMPWPADPLSSQRTVPPRDPIGFDGGELEEPTALCFHCRPAEGSSS